MVLITDMRIWHAHNSIHYGNMKARLAVVLALTDVSISHKQVEEMELVASPHLHLVSVNKSMK